MGIKRFNCEQHHCLRLAEYQCDHCNKHFCSDHGTKGGDREGDETSLTVAVPSMCWRCGGFDVDK